MSSVLCFACKQVGHTRRFCPNKANRQHSVRCFFCDKPGHTKKVCPARQQWLSTQSQPRSTVAAVTDVESSSAAAVHRSNETEAAKCLCTVSSVGGLPRVFVETSCAADFRDSLRARSAVDTGATRTMITADMLTRIGTWTGPKEVVAITAFWFASIHSRSGRKSPPCVVMMRPPLLRGTPEVVRMDNGTEFSNAIVESLFQVFNWHYRSHWCGPASAVTRRC